MKILVCGGAGYVGSHMCKMIANRGHEPVTFDNLSSGHDWAVKWGPLVEGDLLDVRALASLFASHRFDAVMHFAAKSQVAESMLMPLSYYRNNFVGTLNLLDAMRNACVTKLVFSSTAAVYGNPDYVPIDELHPTRPISSYGWSKLMAEQAIRDVCMAHGASAACLRYFNAAGADSSCQIGEAHEPETHLIPNMIMAALDPVRRTAILFGNDYNTPDGTCIRDYVHVEDLCDAHLRALGHLDATPGFHVFNLGSGQGHSVAEVVAACREHCGAGLETVYAARRQGDPPVLVASIVNASVAIGWRPTRPLKDCIATAYAWYKMHL